VPEICRDAILYAGMDDADDWASQIVALGAGQGLRAAKIAGGRVRASAFTWAAAGTRLAEILTRLVEQRG
jgi:hypothetical protein